MIARKLIPLAFPYKFEERVEGAVETLEKLIKEGYGTIFFFPHFSENETLLSPVVIADNVQGVTDKNFEMPIALHMANKPGLKAAARFADIDMPTLVTSDTGKKEIEFKAKGKEILWDSSDPEAYTKVYALRTRRNLKGGGVVGIAPQGGRRPKFAEFEPGVIGLVEAVCKRVDKVCVVFVGVSIPGITDYSKEKVGGLNIRKEYLFTMGDVMTMQELKDSAKEHGVSLEQEIYNRMLPLVDEPYKPQPSEA